METPTRPLTIEEMYFNKGKRLHLPADTNKSTVNNNFLESGGQVPPTPRLPETSTMDLSNQVFPPPSFSEKAGTFIKKNWGWLLLGTGVLVFCIVVHEKNKKNKKKNQLPTYPHGQV